MPKQIDPRIRRAVERIAHRGGTAPEVHRELAKAIAVEKFEGGLPSVRTISDILKKAKQQQPSERYSITEVTWPESFSDPPSLVPWEAAGAYFELLAQLDGRRPLLPLVHWFWRLTLAAPDADARIRYRTAGDLAVWECLPIPDAQKPDVRSIELYLMFRPWRSKEATAEYEKRVPPASRYEPDESNWWLKHSAPGQVDSLGVYGLELAHGVFTLEARDHYLEYMKQDKEGGRK